MPHPTSPQVGAPANAVPSNPEPKRPNPKAVTATKPRTHGERASKAPERLVGAVMCDQDEKWQASRCFPERKVSELYDERPSDSPGVIPSAEREFELWATARRAINASLELADELEAAQDEAAIEGSGWLAALPVEWPLHQLSRHYLIYSPLVHSCKQSICSIYNWTVSLYRCKG